MRAWAVTMTCWPEIVSIVAATTRGQAIANQFNGCLEAGYDVPWTKFRARRAQAHDQLAARSEKIEVLGWRHEETEQVTRVTTYGCLRKGAGEEMTAEQWNDLYPEGTRVLYRPILGRDDGATVTTTRSQAWTLGSGEPVVMINGKSGGVALRNLEVRD